MTLNHAANVDSVGVVTPPLLLPLDAFRLNGQKILLEEQRIEDVCFFFSNLVWGLLETWQFCLKPLPDDKKPETQVNLEQVLLPPREAI